ncbi:MAG: glycosyltransferase family 4 protein [Chloroflexi bacterium]|nr:glycosyltransferase family 4 protein [Chloroflexota bacterium]
MKVRFLVGDIFPPKAHGGGNLFNRKMGESLRSKGEVVDVIDLADLIAGFRQRWHTLERFRVAERIARVLWLAVHLPKPSNAVIFEDHYFLRDVFLYNLLMTAFRRAVIVAGVYHFEEYRSDGSGWRHAWQRFKERLYLLGVQTEVAISRYTARELESLGQPASKIRLVPCGIDGSEIKRYPKEPSDKVNLLFVGHYRPRKGVDHLVDAFCRLNAENAVLHLVGKKEDPQYFERIVAMARENGLEDRIIFHGQVDRDQLSHLYSQADIFVFPSLQEGFGIVLLEAMSYGLPIVASNVSAIPELVIDGENGFLVPPADPDALAAAITKLIEEPRLRREMGEAGYRIASAYSWERSGELFYKIIRELQKAA